ncbi:MAG: hypothetical protein JWL72_4202 [Ilumatobacteraceae bacterium]|nr:hypothetical protein [Ilumatobacteraceae bacterium]MCU1390864.1 hypothetical protein [Ilumatobacteraceae bacterium]
MSRASRCCILIVVAGVLGGCSSDAPSPKTSSPAVAAADTGQASNDSTAPAGSVGGGTGSGSANPDCANLTDALAKILVNWQVVLGLVHSPTSDWASNPIGTVADFADQLATARAGLGTDAAAAAAIDFMSGANDIVVRGVGGDAKAQADLATYLGTDTAANIGKQSDISLAFVHSSCSS